MKEFFKKFIAVDNSVNEQTVMGVLWAVVAVGSGITSIFVAGALPLFYSSLSSSLLCFGLNWKYK